MDSEGKKEKGNRELGFVSLGHVFDFDLISSNSTLRLDREENNKGEEKKGKERIGRGKDWFDHQSIRFVLVWFGILTINYFGLPALAYSLTFLNGFSFSIR